MADEGSLGLLGVDLRKIIYSLYQVSMACGPEGAVGDDGQSISVAAKVLGFSSLSHFQNTRSSFLYRRNEIISQMGDLDNLCKVIEQRVPLQVLQ